MTELGLDTSTIARWFEHERNTPYVLVRVAAEDVNSWVEVLAEPVRRCYIADDSAAARAAQTGRTLSELVAAKLPDPGSVMAGDFGEILVYIYQAVREQPDVAIGPKKWRLKQDRTKSAPYSDVVHMIMPEWPNASLEDRLLCAEVKTKSTGGAASPISAAIADCQKDRTSRLSKTLVWLKERALIEDLGTTTVQHLERFIKAIDYPPARRLFRAVAVVCSSLLEDELADAPIEAPNEYTVVVISVPNLKSVYEAVFVAAQSTAAEMAGAT